MANLSKAELEARVAALEAALEAKEAELSAANETIAELSAKRTRIGSRKEGLREPQVRLLRVLAAEAGPIPKTKACFRAEVDPTKAGVFIGPRTGESAKTTERWPFPGLVELGFVDVTVSTEGKGTTVAITDAGREALAALPVDAGEEGDK